MLNTNKKSGMELKKNPDGSSNKKYVDLLDEDSAISGQKFVCLSFISPENEIKQRESYFFQEYINQWDMNKSLQKYSQFLSFIAFKHNLDYNILDKDFADFCKDEKENLFTTTLQDEYKTFIDQNEDSLMEKYNNEVSFQTSVRGIKVRGAYPTQKEAELRCKLLREIDPTHDVYVGPVGSWMPFHPEAYKTGRVEYLEEELNQLMHEKEKNDKNAKIEFEKRVKETKKKAIEENKKKALESNNPLTQTINENGDLVSVANVASVEKSLGNENVAVADIRKELFEGDNIVTDFKNNDHGFSKLEEIKKKMKSKQIKEDDSETQNSIVMTDEVHDVDCKNGVCTLPEFKKCVSTGEPNEILCECMADKTGKLYNNDDEQKNNIEKDNTSDNGVEDV